MAQAHAFARLSREFHMTQEQIATRTGNDRVSVSNYMRLLSMPESVQKLVESSQLSFGHAKALLGLKLHPGFEKAAQKVANLSLSVRQTENLVQGMLFPEKNKKDPKVDPPVDPNVKEVEEQLQRALGLKVHIEDKNGRGRVIIEYGNIADFDGLLEQLSGK
jgi:ParB family chromosome partitioning protein